MLQRAHYAFRMLNCSPHSLAAKHWPASTPPAAAQKRPGTAGQYCSRSSRTARCCIRSSMKPAAYRALWLLLLLCLAASSSGLTSSSRAELKRQTAKRWRHAAEVSRLRARSAARHFLEDRGADLVVPVEVEVVLVGFSGDGGYGYTLDSSKLLSMLSSHLQWYCPYSWETEEELGVCVHVNFQVLAQADNAMVGVLLHKAEAHLKASMVHSHTSYDASTVHTATQGYRTYYTVEASKMEPVFDEFMQHLYSEDPSMVDAEAVRSSSGADGTGSVITGSGRLAPWHKHNTIFVINPSKVRINPAGQPAAASHRPPNIIEQWQKGNTNSSLLETEEAGYIYRYQYNGVGEGVTWLSSRNYMVVDLAAGPTTYGPLLRQGGAATPQGIPSIKDTYYTMLTHLRMVEQQMTVHEAAIQAADTGEHTLLGGRLAATLASAVKAVFVPDVSSQHVEQARTLLVPLVILSDAPIPPESTEAVDQQAYWGINITHIEQALSHLLGEGQEAVVISAQHELHQHKQLAAALHKATRSHSEAVVDIPEGRDYHGTEMGMHVTSQTFIDPEALLQEIEQSADMLTHGLVSVAHTGSNEMEHHINQLRHDGTRVVPVFVLALQNHPEDVVMANKELVAASDDAVVVLQLRQGAKWGGPNDFFGGHMANGRRVVTDGKASTRHVIAGLAQALGGLTPPYRHYEPAIDGYEYDWRWAVGATPWGPYSNYSGVSELMQNLARRNSLLTHTSAALRQLQHQLDAVDEFVKHHFQGPWEHVGLKDAGRHWLDTVAGTRHGYNTTLSAEVVYTIEATLGNVTNMLEQLAMDMFSHDFVAADKIVGQQLLPTVAKLAQFLDDELDAAADVMQCCQMGRVNLIGQAMLVIWTCAGAAGVFFLLIAVAQCALIAKRKAVGSFGLPTYGLPTYSGKSGKWTW